MVDPTSSPQLEFTFELRVNIGSTLELGQGSCGTRRNVPIKGGTFHGPQLSGRVLPGGADWQFVESDGLTFVDAQYVIETEDGIRIEVRNRGIRHGSEEVLARIAAGESVLSMCVPTGFKATVPDPGPEQHLAPYYGLLARLDFQLRHWPNAQPL